MIGIVVVTHGHLAEEMLRTLRGVLGPLKGVAGVNAAGRDDPEVLRLAIAEAVDAVESGEGCLILTDMLGDSATNLSLAVSRKVSCEVVAGVNMPMLVKAVTSRSGIGLRPLAERIHEYGRSHIVWASRDLGRAPE